jgi:GrpB-like predicted nucleotidyltransferase (UPF0157 family)
MGHHTVSFVREAEVREPVASVFGDLQAFLSEWLPRAEIEHVGATSVPGALTKGDLDICVRVESARFDEADRLLGERFARNADSEPMTGLSQFCDSIRNVDVGIQLVLRDGEADFFVRWRDMLRESPELRERYDELERRWNGLDRERYRADEARFIGDALASRPASPRPG